MKAPQDVLIRFHEIALKGKNRPMFIKQLVDNVRRATVGVGVSKVWSGRMIVRLSLEEGADFEAVRERVSRVFGDPTGLEEALDLVEVQGANGPPAAPGARDRHARVPGDQP